MPKEKLKIAIYGNELTFSNSTGVKIYTREIIKGLGKLDRENQYIVYLNDKTGSGERELDYLKDLPNFTVRISKSGMPFWTYLEFPRMILEESPDVLFMPIQSVPFFKKPEKIKIVSTIHDVAYLRFPDHFTFLKKKLLHFHTKRAANMSDRIIVPSGATKKDVMQYYRVAENKIEIIYHGSRSSAVKPDEKFEEGLRNLKPYILFTGSIQPRKNINVLIKAFCGLKRDHADLKLVVAGPKGWMCKGTLEAADRSGRGKDILFMGNVGDDYLSALYENAAVFAMPSLYEGFGLPVVEAMSHGTPCAVSDNSSLKEIAGDAALLFDPEDISDIEQKIRSLLDDADLKSELSKRAAERSKIFSWRESARKHLEVFKCA